MSTPNPKDVELTDVLKRSAIYSGWSITGRHQATYFTARRGEGPEEFIAVRVSNGEIDMSTFKILRNIDPLHAVDLMIDHTEKTEDSQ